MLSSAHTSLDRMRSSRLAIQRSTVPNRTAWRRATFATIVVVLAHDQIDLDGAVEVHQVEHALLRNGSTSIIAIEVEIGGEGVQ
ncbi:MAG: hypothetical protein IPG63_17570 [Xanthomonadales bacterium]|nr:hypothetical protein [Xanthomonadales bacterium]